MTVELNILSQKDSFKDIVRDIYNGLVSLGWKNTATELHIDGAEEPVENKTKSVDRIIECVLNQRKWRQYNQWATAKFMKGEQLFVMLVGGRWQYEIELAFYETLFEQGRGLDELKDLFSMLSLPEGTQVQGDGSWNIDEHSDEKTWIFKRGLRRERYFWIDQVKEPRWRRIVSNFPELADYELAKTGDKYVVAFGESPYIEDKEKVRRLPRNR
ncbi:MAG: hypothetical protein V3U09_06650 [Thermoplasmata archaeon]